MHHVVFTEDAVKRNTGCSYLSAWEKHIWVRQDPRFGVMTASAAETSLNCVNYQKILLNTARSKVQIPLSL